MFQQLLMLCFLKLKLNGLCVEKIVDKVDIMPPCKRRELLIEKKHLEDSLTKLLQLSFVFEKSDVLVLVGLV